VAMDGTAGVSARREAEPRGSVQPWLAPQPRKPAVAMDGTAGV
jgi:hypothetical protein